MSSRRPALSTGRSVQEPTRAPVATRIGESATVTAALHRRPMSVPSSGPQIVGVTRQASAATSAVRGLIAVAYSSQLWESASNAGARPANHTGRMYLAMIRSLLACMASMSETEERGSVRTTPSTLASSIASSTASDHEATPPPSASYSMTDADQFWPPLSRAAVT